MASATPGARFVEEEEGAVFFLEVIVGIVRRNRDRSTLLWPMAFDHLAGILREARVANTLTERAVVGLLRLCSRLLHKDQVAADLQAALDLILRLCNLVFDSLGGAVAFGLKEMLKANASNISSPAAWKCIFALLERLAPHKSAATLGFDTLTMIVLDTRLLTPETFLPSLEAVAAYAACRVHDSARSLRALDFMGCMHQRSLLWVSPQRRASSARDPSASASHTSDTAAGDAAKTSKSDLEGCPQFWLPALQTLSTLCYDPRGDVRDYAMICLQRQLLSSHGHGLPASAWLACFEQVLFPLLAGLLESKGLQSAAPEAIDKTRLRAWLLISKIFLHQLDSLGALADFRSLWLEILGHMERYMSASQTEVLSDTIPETLRNILHVMAATDIFSRDAKVQTSGGKNLWQETWQQVDRFCPSLRIAFFAKGQEPDLELLKESLPPATTSAIAGALALKASTESSGETGEPTSSRGKVSSPSTQ